MNFKLFRNKEIKHTFLLGYMTRTKRLVKVCGPGKDEHNLQIAIKKHTLGWECGLVGEHLDSTGKVLGSRIQHPRK